MSVWELFRDGKGRERMCEREREGHTVCGNESCSVGVTRDGKCVCFDAKFNLWEIRK